MALTEVWLPTMERNQSPSLGSSLAKASQVAEKPPAEMV